MALFGDDDESKTQYFGYDTVGFGTSSSDSSWNWSDVNSGKTESSVFTPPEINKKESSIFSAPEKSSNPYGSPPSYSAYSISNPFSSKTQDGFGSSWGSVSNWGDSSNNSSQGGFGSNTRTAWSQGFGASGISDDHKLFEVQGMMSKSADPYEPLNGHLEALGMEHSVKNSLWKNSHFGSSYGLDSVASHSQSFGWGSSPSWGSPVGSGSSSASPSFFSNNSSKPDTAPGLDIFKSVIFGAKDKIS